MADCAPAPPSAATLWSRNPELGVATLALAIAEAAVILVLVVVLIIMCCRKKATVAPETPKRASAEDDAVSYEYECFDSSRMFGICAAAAADAGGGGRPSLRK